MALECQIEDWSSNHVKCLGQVSVGHQCWRAFTHILVHRWGWAVRSGNSAIHLLCISHGITHNYSVNITLPWQCLDYYIVITMAGRINQSSLTENIQKDHPITIPNTPQKITAMLLPPYNPCGKPECPVLPTTSALKPILMEPVAAQSQAAISLLLTSPFWTLYVG
jgi:hypothetical protein